MRLIFICDNCKVWNEFDHVRDEKSNSSYSIYEANDMGLDFEVDIESSIECNDKDAEIPINEIDDYDEFFESTSEAKSVTIKCRECGDIFKIEL